MSRDAGRFYEPGTINIIILTNMALRPRAMTRAVISATEATAAALLDMDIRSAYSPLELKDLTGKQDWPVVQKMALNAILKGALEKTAHAEH